MSVGGARAIFYEAAQLRGLGGREDVGALPILAGSVEAKSRRAGHLGDTQDVDNHDGGVLRAGAVVLALGLSLVLTACSAGDASPEPSLSASTAGLEPSDETRNVEAAEGTSKPGRSEKGKGSPRGTSSPDTVVPEEIELRQRPESRVIQEWAAAYAEIVNDSDETAALAKKVMTKDGLERMKFYTHQDWGRFFPGPLPVTVTQIRQPRDGITWVAGCAWMRGWSQASETDPQRDEREITPVEFGVVERAGAWLVDGMSNGKDGACVGVELEGQTEQSEQ